MNKFTSSKINYWILLLLNITEYYWILTVFAIFKSLNIQLRGLLLNIQLLKVSLTVLTVSEFIFPGNIHWQWIYLPIRRRSKECAYATRTDVIVIWYDDGETWCDHYNTWLFSYGILCSQQSFLRLRRYLSELWFVNVWYSVWQWMSIKQIKKLTHPGCHSKTPVNKFIRVNYFKSHF